MKQMTFEFQWSEQIPWGGLAFNNLFSLCSFRLPMSPSLLFIFSFSQRTDVRGLPQVTRVSQGSSGTVITLVSMAIVGGVLVLAMAVACFRHYAQQVANGKLGLGPEGGAETHFDYQVRKRKDIQD